MNYYRYLKGPVYSRRIGRSLGITIIDDKSCSFDCVYCEVGQTSQITIKRKEYVDTAKIIAELDGYLNQKPKLDYITFSSTGEPTLHLKIKEIIDFIKNKHSQYKIALLSNSSLFYKKEVRKDILDVDLIIPSLDAASKKVFEKINRPHPTLKIKKIINGLINLRKEFKGKIWLEIFIIEGINDTNNELNNFIQIIKIVNPDKVQLNSLDRPAPENWVTKVSINRMKEIKAYLSTANCKIEII